MTLDTAWQRLSGAWHFGLHRPGAAETTFVHGAAHHPGPPADPASMVVVASAGGVLSGLAEPLRLRSPGGDVVACGIEACDDIAALELVLGDRRVKALVLDVELCEEWGATVTDRLRSAHPEVDWILSWQEPSVRWLDRIINCRAKGCLPRATLLEHLAGAVDAVTRGGLWFTPEVSQWLYLTMLEQRANVVPAQALHNALPASLTAREAETMMLLRQGCTNKQIALTLDISVNTVKKHLAHAFPKLGLHKRRSALT